MMMCSTWLSWRRIVFLAAAIAVGILLVAFSNSFDQHYQIPPSMEVLQGSKQTHHYSASHRKLLSHDKGSAAARVKPIMFLQEICTKDDIEVIQTSEKPLPSGIPVFSVDILNLCTCNISNIHMSCGWFSSAGGTINPKVFKRVQFNDCLVNNGNSIASGTMVSFYYANTFSYPLSVSHVDIEC